VAVPSFLLRKLYVKGSLKATEDGFQFALRNNLAPGSIIGLAPLTIDDTSYPPEAITIKGPAGEWRGDEINSRNPLNFGLNVQVTVTVQGEKPAPGEHHVVFAVLTREVGRIEIDLTDTL
jgi:hydroxymethylglutaryl-CoA reductase (NADPH)